MEGFNNFRFNPRRYEDHLSTFGRKVLSVLVQKWKDDQNRMKQSRHEYYQHGNSSVRNRRVLTFSDERNSGGPPFLAVPTNFEEINNEYEHGRTPIDFNFIEQNVSHRNTVPTNLQLIQTIDASTSAASMNEMNIAGHDLVVNSAIEGRISKAIYEEMQNNNLNIAHIPAANDNKGNQEDSNDVDWHNMFDTELLSSEAAIANAQLVLEQTTPSASSTFNIEFPRLKNETKRKEKSNTLAKEPGSKKSKTKNQNITEPVPKRVNKVQPKISFRKQKYTKAVKNWLNDIDPTNPVERDIAMEPNEPKTFHAGIEIEKNKEKSIKKVVQTQLANKDGIMKFGKPKIINMQNFESGTVNNLSPSEESNITEIETTKKNTADKSLKKNKNPKENKTDKTANKDKKTMQKFVPPIKSQLPVQEVEFQIAQVDESNAKNHAEALTSVVNQDLVLVLIYRNGFCQLNDHHTEDTCDPEGFLLGVGEEFLFFKEHHPMIRDTLQSLLEKNNIICYDGKSLLVYLKSKFELDIYELNMIDAEIGGSILAPDDPPENFSELQKLISFTPQFTIATECVLQKTAWYSTLLKECASKLVSLLTEEQLWNVFVNIEMKLLPIIADMERYGISVDLQKLKSMEEILVSAMKRTELACHQAAGRTFQINSPAQVRALIYDDLKLDAKCNLKVRETLAQGAKSTCESMLRGLVSLHPLPRLILEYRHLHKALATFLAGVATHVKDGTVKPTWVQTAAATGRIASNNPNLQAIPKVPFSLVLFPEHSEPEGSGVQGALSFRSVYRARAGCTLLACDFKHVECRVFAHYAPDPALHAALSSAEDLFRVLAHEWLQKPASEVSCEERERTKRIVYASLYGCGVRKLMDILHVGYDQALAVHTSFNRTFPSLKSFGESVVSRCEAAGGRLVTLGGRMRRFQHISSTDLALRAQAQRQAVNFIIQGSAADLCKLAMVGAHAGLRSHAPPLEARLLLQIHDELVWEVREQHLHGAADVIRRAMEECGLHSGMQHALPVALSVGADWGHMQQYLPWQ